MNTRKIETFDHTLKHSILEVHIRNRHIKIEVEITGPSTYFIYQKLYRLLSSTVLSTCLPIRGLNLVRKYSCFAGHMIRKPLTWYQYMHSFCSGSPLIFHSRCQKHSPWSWKTKNICICFISTSDIPCIDIQCIFHPSSNFCSWYNSTSYITSDGTDEWQCNPWLKQRFAVYNIKWWTSGRHELTWLWFFSIDINAACSMVTLFVI